MIQVPLSLFNGAPAVGKLDVIELVAVLPDQVPEVFTLERVPVTVPFLSNLNSYPEKAAVTDVPFSVKDSTTHTPDTMIDIRRSSCFSSTAFLQEGVRKLITASNAMKRAVFILFLFRMEGFRSI